MAETSDVAFISVHHIIRPHAEFLLDETGQGAFGRGWQNIVAQAFAAWADVLRRTPGARLRISSVGERAGCLATVCESAGGTAPGKIDMEEIRRVQREAETASLRTCDRCGRGGILRSVGDGVFATRCREHAEVVTGRMQRGPYIPILEIVRNLLTSHGDWLNFEGSLPELPRGWLGLVTEAFVHFRELPRGRNFRLLGMKPVCGRFEIIFGHDAEDLDLPQNLAWRSAVLALGDAAFWTCDVCGAAGRIRQAERGMPAPRCDLHDDLSRWRSCQRAAQTPVDPWAVITSARSQWSASAFRTTAKLVVAPVAVTSISHPAAKPPAPNDFPLYDLRDVSAALGLANDDAGDDPFDVGPSPPDNEQQGRIRRILERGDAGRWRRLAHPDRSMVERLDALAARAPHLRELASLVRRHLLAALHMGLPVTLPPVLLVGPPGVGKTWFLSGLAEVLNVPFRAHPLTGASHSDSIGGSHGVWRNSQVGLVSKTLLAEAVANPVIFVDEFDKIPPSQGVDDLHRPFYILLEPIGAKQFVDAYLGFPVDASAILWVMAANCTKALPSPILNRLTVIKAALPDEAHLVQVALSVYADCNNRRRAFFPPEPSSALVERLKGMSPRTMRLTIEDAMTVCAAAGRREVLPDDVTIPEQRSRTKIGFV